MDPFVGEIRVFSFQKIPVGWLPCNGQTLNIKQYTALYALLGTQFGGDGQNTFNLPNLQGAVVMPSVRNKTSYITGATGGSETVTLTTATAPSHTHTMAVNTTAPTVVEPPASSFLAPMQIHQSTTAGPLELINSYAPQATGNPPAPTNPVTLPANVMNTFGGGGAHENRQPYQVLNVCIATAGDFPPRN